MRRKKIPTKQMKVFLSLQEHIVVRAAAHLQGVFMKDYMKQAVLEQAKKDTKSFDKVIESVGKNNERAKRTKRG